MLTSAGASAQNQFNSQTPLSCRRLCSRRCAFRCVLAPHQIQTTPHSPHTGTHFLLPWPSRVASDPAHKAQLSCEDQRSTLESKHKHSPAPFGDADDGGDIGADSCTCSAASEALWSRRCRWRRTMDHTNASSRAMPRAPKDPATAMRMRRSRRSSTADAEIPCEKNPERTAATGCGLTGARLAHITDCKGTQTPESAPALADARIAGRGFAYRV